MPQLIWSRTALADVHRLYLFIAEKDSKAARRMIATLRSSIAPLSGRPTMGRPVPGLGPNHRRWVVKFGRSAYVITYRVSKDEVVLLTVRHEREAPPGP